MSVATCAAQPAGAAAEPGVTVLDLVYILGVIAVFALVAVIGKAVERL